MRLTKFDWGAYLALGVLLGFVLAAQRGGLLWRAAYAEAFVRDRFLRAGYGRERIRADLKRRGLGATDIDRALSAVVDDQAERERAEGALARFMRLRARRKPRDDARLRDAAFRHLVGRGFPGDLVRDLLSGSR